MDQAGWHTASNLVLPENLNLVILPPNPLQLDPIERLRWRLRGNSITHRAFRTDEIIDGCCRAENLLLAETASMRSLVLLPLALGAQRSVINQVGIIAQIAYIRDWGAEYVVPSPEASVT